MKSSCGVASSALGIEAAALEPYRIARGQAASDPTPDVVELRDAVGPYPAPCARTRASTIASGG